MADSPRKTRFTPYQIKLFVFLSVATFFEGFDFFALTLILSDLQLEWDLSDQAIGILFAAVNAGTVVAWLLVRKADRWGRKTVLSITILGYALFTFLSGCAWNVWSFAFFQFCARVFLIGEWATAAVYAAEEYPADRRGTVIGVLQAFSSLGAITCAGLMPFMVGTQFGWRTVYFVGVVPLLILAFARRGLKETKRFEERRAAGPIEQTSMTRILHTPHRKRVLQLGAIWLVTYACSNTAVSFFEIHATTDLSWTKKDVSQVLTISAIASLPMVFMAGKLLDVIGRKRGAAIIFTATSIGVFLAYTVESKWALVPIMSLAVFGVSSVLPVLNAFTNELFPTEYRADAFAWTNNLIGRIGYVLAPIGIGIVAAKWSWGAAIAPTAIFPLIALGLIYLWLPETNNRELEETSAPGFDGT
jgi:putative MFS transporter